MKKITLFLMSLFLTVGAMAQTLVDYKIVTAGDGVTGVLSRTDTNTQSSWRDLFTFTTTESNPALLKLQVTNPSAPATRFNIYAQNDGVRIESGDGHSTYTLSVPAPYMIVSYSFDVKANTAGNVITPENGKGESLTITTSVQNFSVQNINSSSAVFELTGTNNRTNVCTNFVVKVCNKFDNKYLTLQCVNGGKYLTSTIGTTSDCRRLVMNANEKDVFYYTGNALLSYTEGKYMKVSAKGQRYEMYWDEVGVETPVAIGIQSNGDGMYSVTLGNKNQFVNNTNAGYRYLHGTNSYTDSGTSASLPTDNGYKWYIAEATTLPVTITAAKYATFYAPVAVAVPTGVTAHTATINGNWVTLNEIEGGVIPANTGVVLYSETAGTYNLTITEEAEAIASDLRGSVAATYYTTAGTYYALGLVNGEVGFYRDEFNNSRFQNNSHKAYLYVAGQAPSASLRFEFAGTTAIEEVETETAETIIYDLTGRRVNEITKAGVYIIGGKKTLVK